MLLVNKLLRYKKFLVLGLDQALVSITGLSLTILVSRIFGLEELGMFVIAQIGYALCILMHSAFVNMPIATRASNPIDKKRFEMDSYFATLNLLVILFLTSLILIIYFVSLIFPNLSYLQEIILGILFSIPSMLCFHYIRAIMLVKFDYFKVLKMDFTYTSFLLLGIVLLKEVDGSNAIDILYICSFAWFAGVISVIKSTLKLYKVDTQRYKEIFLSCWKESKWLFGYRSIAYIKTNLLIVVLAFTSGPSSVGILRLIQTIYGPLNIFLAGLDSFVPQYGSAIYKNGSSNKMLLFFFKLFMFLVAIWVFYSILIGLFWKDILEVFFEAPPLDIKVFVIFQSLVSLLVISNTILPYIIRVLGSSRILTLAPVYELLLFLIPGILLIQNYSLSGAFIWQISGMLFTVTAMIRFLTRAKIFKISYAKISK